jgi:hypothetical protein
MQEPKNSIDRQFHHETATCQPSSQDIDQIEVESYFASEEFQRVPPSSRIPRKERRVWPNRDISPATSFSMALVGFSLVYLLVGLFTGPAIDGLYASMDPANEMIAYCVVGQMFFIPMLVGLAMATVTPLFWYGSVLARFALASAVVLPGAIAFVMGCDADGAAESLFAMFLSIALVTVLVQLWTQWTISHSRAMDTPIQPTGTRSIMELTGIASVCCAVFAALDLTDIGLTVVLGILVSAIAAVAIVGMMIAQLRPRGGNLFAALISGLFAFTGSAVLCGSVAIFGVGFRSIGTRLPELIGVTVMGTAIFLVLMLMGIWWLRTCGWVCLNREQEKMARDAEAESPWHRWFPEEPASEDSESKVGQVHA